MKKLSLTAMFILTMVLMLLATPQAQEYLLAWKHNGPVEKFKITAGDNALVVVGPSVREWVIPENVKSGTITVEACNKLEGCSTSKIDIPLPAPPTNLQIGLLGNGIPTGEEEPTPDPPSNLGNFFPADDSIDVATNVTFTATGDNFTSCTLLLDVVNPPMTGPDASSACAFTQTLLESTTYFYQFEICNPVGCIDSGVLNLNTVTPGTENLLTDGDNALSAGMLTKGLVLPEGVATGGVVVVDSEGGTLVTQTDVKTTWPDGSIRFAVVTVEIPEAGIYNVKDSTASVGTFVPVVPSVDVDFTIYPLEGGFETGTNTTHSAIAPAVLSSDCWLNGPLVKECRDVVELDNSPANRAAFLNVYVDRRVYHNGQSRVDLMVNNMQRSTVAGETGALIYTAVVNVNGSPVYSLGAAPVAGNCSLTSAGSRLTCTNHTLDEGDFVIISDTNSANYGKFARVLTKTANTADYYSTPLGTNTTPVAWVKVPQVHPFGSRWRKTFNANGLVEAVIQEDFSSLLAAKAMPSYVPEIIAAPTIMEGVGTRCWVNPSGNSVNESTSVDPTKNDWCWKPLAIADHQPFMAGPGARDEIGGIVPGVYARFFVHRTQELRANMLRTADLGASWRVHIVHPGTDSMVDLIDVPQMSGQNVAVGSLFHGGAANVGYTAEIGAAHHPGYAYLPYLVTGDRFYKEEMKHWANWGLNSFSWLRGGSQGLLRGQQVRGGAWALRDLANNAYYLPDDDEHKSYFTTLVQTNLTDYDVYAGEQEIADPNVKQWRIGRSQCGTDPASGTAEYCTGEFMNAYLALCLQHVLRQNGGEFTGGETARNYLVDFLVYLYSDPTWQSRAGVFHHKSKIAATGATFASFQEMFDYNFTSVPPGHTPPRIQTTNFVNAGRSGDYRLALVVALAAGRPNAQVAYDYLMSWPCVMPDITLRGNDALGIPGCVPGYSHGSQLGIANID